MSDETKSSLSAKNRRQKQYILVVNNPGPDEGSSSGEERVEPVPAHTFNYHARPLPSPTPPASIDRSQAPAAPHMPPPLTTNIPDQRFCYPSTRSNPSNPALSSPSSTGSMGFDTPPPTTPGQSLPPVDLSSLSGESTIRPEAVVSPTPDGSDRATHVSRPARVLANLKSHIPRVGHGRQTSSNSRPPSSPSTSTSNPDPYTSPPAPAPIVASASSEQIILMVTDDSDHFSTVDISGAMTPAFIKERIFSKLRISDEDQPRYSIYLTEIGKFAIGDALTDEHLFELSRRHGDDKGTLKLFVTPSSALVHEPSRDLGPDSPIVNMIPPPVLPQQGFIAPLRPHPRSRSRHGGSQSSTSERQRPEVANGYEASGSDDERETRRATIRPPAHRTQNSRMESPVVRRTHSPIAMSSDHIVNGGVGIPIHRPDLSPVVLGASPSISPSNRMYDSSYRRPAATATSPDGTPKERYTPPFDSHAGSSRRGPNPVEEGDRYDRDRPKRPLRKDSGSRRAKANENLDEWAIVPPAADVPTSGYSRDRPYTPPDSRPARHPVMRAFPSRPSGGSNDRKKSGGKIVPQGWAVRYEEAAGPGRQAQPAAGFSPNRLNKSSKVAKSTGDLRAMYNPPPSHPQPQPAYPATLVAGPMSRHPPSSHAMANRPSTGGSTTSSSAIPHGASSASEIPSSAHTDASRDATTPRYDLQRTAISPTSYQATRQTPLAYSPGRSNAQAHLGPTSPSAQEPIPRPRSALDDRTPSPYRPQPPRAPDSAHESGLPRPSQISHHVHGHGVSPSQSSLNREGIPPPSRTPLQPRVEQLVDHAAVHNPSVPMRHGPRTPPRSPIAPTVVPYENKAATPPPSRYELAAASSSPNHSTPRDDSSTLASAWAGLVDENAMEGTVRARPPTTRVPLPVQPSSLPSHDRSPSNSYVSRPREPSVCLQDDEDSDIDESVWAVPPSKDKSGLRSQSSRQQLNANHSSRPHLAHLSIEDTPVPQPAPLASDYNSSRTPPANFPGPFDSNPHQPRLTKRPHAPLGASQRDVRTSRFEDGTDRSWAPRPPPEVMYERLEEFFPEHDLDQPVIEMPSGNSSPTSADNPVPAPQRFRHKKSIRVVAEEHKSRISRTSRAEQPNAAANLRKRNTKLWGSKLEEVTTEHARAGIPPVPQDPSPGGMAKPIFRWVRGELIGKGTYGKVYLALNATTGEMIAVKQVEMPRTASDKSDSRQVTVVEALKLESETLKDLDHPNIVQYLGFEETPTFLSIFLEYVPGGSIASCLRKHGKFDEEVTKSFTGQILDGLEYLHGKGILHRDLKADNILVETSGVCKISDFGISKRTDDINMAGAYTSMQGTVFWMAPEVINSQKGGYNSKIDIWSVGCVVYEMWTGQRPWTGQEAVAVLLHLYQTKQGPPVPEEVHLTPLADDFRQKCFAMDPDERPTAAELRRHPYLSLQPGWIFNGFK